MLPNLLDKIKSHQYHLFLAVLIGLVAFTSYNLGQISSSEKGEITIEHRTVNGGQKAEIYSAIEQDNNEQNRKIAPKTLDLRVVVSKNSDKYHYSWCPSVGKIKEENKIWFNSDKEAEAAGYILAGNCLP